MEYKKVAKKRYLKRRKKGMSGQKATSAASHPRLPKTIQKKRTQKSILSL
jgi:hypothetical protein